VSENIFFDKKALKHCGHNVIIGKTVRIRNPEKVWIGDNVILDDFTYISGELILGDYVHIAPGCTISGGGSKVEMGAFSGLSSGCRVYGGSSNYLRCGLDLPTIPKEFQFNVIQEDVRIDSFGLVGAASIILPGCHLSQGVAVAAGVKVRKQLDIQPWHLLLDDEGTQIRRRGLSKLKEKISKFYDIEISDG
jgi:acetyltransferase-like isoleucine patch superfamily enzyme